MELYLVIGCLSVIVIILLLCLRREKSKRQQYDTATEFANQQLQQLYNDLLQKTKLLSDEEVRLSVDIKHNEQVKQQLFDDIEKLNATAKDEANKFYADNMELAKTQLQVAKQDLTNEKQEWETLAKKEYLMVLREQRDDFLAKQTEYIELQQQFSDLQSKVNAAVEASKRQVELDAQKTFYQLNLSPVDIQEIKQIRSIIPYLRDAEPVNKVIYKVYYEKPYTDLAGRVVGADVKTGIYKITNIANQMCYIGQANNIAERWRQHIRRGVGADPPTRNKLYPALLEFGVENFTFEIVEECSEDQLDAREQFWQDYFHAKDFGYSIK